MMGGGVGIASGYLTLISLTEIAGLWYPVSAVVAGIVQCIVTFFIQKFWTFQNRDTASVRRQMIQYGTMAAIFTATAPLLMYAQVTWLGLWYVYAQTVNVCLFS